jgi:hypothetical protein
MSDFGGELQRLMKARDIGVRELAWQVPCNAGYISNLRGGKKRPSLQIAGRIDEVLDAGGMLVALAAGSSSRPTGDGAARRGEFTDALVPDTPVRLSAFSAAQLDDLIVHLDDQWHALVKTDNLLGPRHALSTVLAHLGVIDALLRAVRPPANRYCGWARDMPSHRRGCTRIPPT